MGLKNWEILKCDKNVVQQTAKFCSVPYFILCLLNVKGINEKKDIKNFLFGYNNFLNPFDFADMDKLVVRVNKALAKNEKICVFGDYDADGITATTVIFSYLKSKGANVIYYLPDREKDGYGLNNNLIDEFRALGVNLIFTVDNGVSAHIEVDYANSFGIDTIITDHHRPSETLPNACAVVNPYRTDCKTVFKNFAGVGVAFKTVVALERQNKTSLNELIDKYSELVTVGTIGDSIELVGETRDMVRFGIKKMLNSNWCGLKIILNEILKNSNREIDAGMVAFNVVPIINASGRMGCAEQAVELFLAKTPQEAKKLFDRLINENIARKKIELEIRNTIEAYLENTDNCKHERILFAVGENWHHGILGIVASRITQKYGKPSILINKSGDEAKGSCRSVENFSMHEMISQCSEKLEKFGGHPMAAGINLKTKNIETFKTQIFEYVNSFETMPQPVLKIDCKLNPTLLNREIVELLDTLKPFGVGNKEPVFGFFSIILHSINPISYGKHLRLILFREKFNISVLYFNKVIENFLYQPGEKIDLAVTLHKNNFQNETNFSAFVCDIKLSGLNTQKILAEKQLYENFKLKKMLSKNEVKLLIPTEEDILIVCKYLAKNLKYVQRIDVIYKRIGEKVNPAKIYTILDIMEENNVLKTNWNADKFKIKFFDSDKKIKLSDSKTYNILTALL